MYNNRKENKQNQQFGSEFTSGNIKIIMARAKYFK